MLTSLIAAAEPSKVPFYIAGGVLVIWAVVLSSVGITRPAFPNGVAGQRAVMAISLVLAAVAIGTAIAVK